MVGQRDGLRSQAGVPDRYRHDDLLARSRGIWVDAQRGEEIVEPGARQYRLVAGNHDRWRFPTGAHAGEATTQAPQSRLRRTTANRHVTWEPS
jgi:hypothetical protein